ncbi:unnamed protein product, partial [Allacma fusca]
MLPRFKCLPAVWLITKLVKC